MCAVSFDNILNEAGSLQWLCDSGVSQCFCYESNMFIPLKQHDFSVSTAKERQVLKEVGIGTASLKNQTTDVDIETLLLHTLYGCQMTEGTYCR